MPFKSFLDRIAPPTGSTEAERASWQRQLRALQQEQDRRERQRQEELKEEACLEAIIANDAATTARQGGQVVNCYFCDKQPETPSAQARVEMYRELPSDGSQKRWKRAEIFVPRCEGCKGRQDSFAAADSSGTVAAIIFGAAILIPVLFVSYRGPVFIRRGGIILDILLIGIAAFAIGFPLKILISGPAYLKKWIKPVPERPKEDYPTVAAFLNSGWKIGSPPTF